MYYMCSVSINCHFTAKSVVKNGDSYKHIIKLRDLLCCDSLLQPEFNTSSPKVILTLAGMLGKFFFEYDSKMLLL
jgi:hypothetical protein